MDGLHQSGLSVFASAMRVRRGDSYRSHVAPGLWFGVVVSGQLETDGPVLGHRRWKDRAATVFLAHEAVPSDHFILRDGAMASLFIHVAPERFAPLGLGDELLALEAGFHILDDEARMGRLHQLASHALSLPALAPGRDQALLGASHHVMAELLDAAGLGQHGDPNDLSLSAAEIARLYQARDLLLADLRDPPSVMELAQQTGTNVRKLTSGFRALFGAPPFAYLKQYRLDQAMDALRHGDRSIQAIAAEIGYRPAHLSAAFRTRFGHPPRAYRGSEAR